MNDQSNIEEFRTYLVELLRFEPSKRLLRVCYQTKYLVKITANLALVLKAFTNLKRFFAENSDDDISHIVIVNKKGDKVTYNINLSDLDLIQKKITEEIGNPKKHNWTFREH